MTDTTAPEQSLLNAYQDFTIQLAQLRAEREEIVRAHVKKIDACRISHIEKELGL